MSLGPFDLTGGPFLTLYGCLFVAAIIAGIVIPRSLRPEGRRHRVADLDQLAWLAGGRPRFGDALVARMLASGALKHNGKDMFSIGRRDAAATTAERSVIALEPPVRWADIVRNLRGYAEPLERKLEQAGLLMSRKERANISFWAALPYLTLFTFGATKWVIGDMRHRPIGYLTIFLLFTACFGIVRYFTVNRRTEAGLRAVEDAKTGKDRLRRAPTTDETGLAVALYGTAVLVGSGFADFHKLRKTSGDSGGGGGDGGGGSGCGGGGCGGCGS